MGAVVGALGLGGGPGGSTTNMTNGTNAGALANAQGDVQYGLKQSNLLADATGNGIGNQQNVLNALQGVANGTGPNPAQAQLAQATGQNVANQASLAAGQRGAASNVGLMARQAAQQGSAAQQNAAGQAATAQANQSLGALNQMGGIANAQASNQIQATTSDTQAQLSNLQAQQGAQAAYNSAQSGVAAAQAGAASGLAGNALGGAANYGVGAIGNIIGGSSAATPQAASTGATAGMAGFMAEGGFPGDMGAGTPAANGGLMNPGPQSTLGQALANRVLAKGGMPMSNGGSVPVKLSPKEKVLPPGKAQQFAKGGPMKATTVPGKPKVPGKNDYANDTYSTSLKPGSIVIPLESLHSNEDARRFVQATLAKKGKK